MFPGLVNMADVKEVSNVRRAKQVSTTATIDVSDKHHVASPQRGSLGLHYLPKSQATIRMIATQLFSG